jgi:hypothetical protein
MEDAVGKSLLRTIAAVLIIVAALVNPRVVEAANNGTNVLFIMVDDLNDWVTHLKGEAGGGPPAATPPFTPNIDALAASGVTFTRAYAPAPVCNPSRAALLGGRRPGFTGVYDNSHDWKSAFRSRNIIPITKHFKDNGYNVMGVGKIYHPTKSPVTAYSNEQLFSSYTAGSGGGGGELNLNGLDLKTFDWGTPTSADIDSETLDYNGRHGCDRQDKPSAHPAVLHRGRPVEAAPPLVRARVLLQRLRAQQQLTSAHDLERSGGRPTPG